MCAELFGAGAGMTSADRQIWRGSSSVRVGREGGPGSGHAFEFVLASRVELQARSGGEVDDGSRYEDLAWPGQCSDPTCNVHRDAGDVAGSVLDLAGVESGPQGDSLFVGGMDERGCATDRPRR